MMKLFRTTLLSALFLGLVTTAQAGHDGKKACEGEVAACLKEKAAHLAKRGWLGIEFDHASKDSKVMAIKAVMPDSPAQKAGFQVGDVIVALNGIDYSNKDNEEKLSAAYKGFVPGGSVTYTIERAGAKQDLTATLAPMPEAVMARWIGEYTLAVLKEREEVAQAKP